MKVTPSFWHVVNSRKRFIIEQGGARAGKTYNILLALIEIAYANSNAGLYFSIVRKTGPALASSVYRDFIDILERENIYSPTDHNKTSKEYQLYGNTF